MCAFLFLFAVCALFFSTCFFSAYSARLLSGASFARVTAFCVFLLMLFLCLFGLGYVSSTLCVLCGSAASVPILLMTHTHAIFIYCMYTCMYISYACTCPFAFLHTCTPQFTHKHPYPCPVMPCTSSWASNLPTHQPIINPSLTLKFIKMLKFCWNT